MKICTILPVLLGLMAFICSNLANFWCNTIKFSSISDRSDFAIDGNGNYANTQVDAPYLGMGPWFRQVVTAKEDTSEYNEPKIELQRQCVNLRSDDFDIDGKWKTVRSMTVLSMILGAAGLVALTLSLCSSIPCFTCLAWMFILLLPFVQGLTFLLFSSNACTSNPLADDTPEGLTDEAWSLLVNNVYQSECDWSVGSTANVLGIVAWFFTGILLLCSRRDNQAVAEDGKEDKKKKDDKEDREGSWLPRIF